MCWSTKELNELKANITDFNGTPYVHKEYLDNSSTQLISKGDKVSVVDGSYMMKVEKKTDSLVHCSGSEFRSYEQPNYREVLTVVAVNVIVPTFTSVVDSAAHANNIILSRTNGDVVFASRINLRRIK